MSRIYDLGPFRLDADVGAFTRAGSPVMLGARAVAVLALLVEHAHHFVSKARILDTAWPGVVVEENNLPVQVRAIRRVLAQVPGAEHWIETLPRRGYRFVGPVARVDDARHDEHEAERSNLPRALTSFVGRERDLVEIKRLLPTKRLITIVGVGGIGKTRLALQVAGEVIGAYRNGVWFVDLGSLRDPALVASNVAQVLAVPERPEKSPSEALHAHLRALQLLLIVDNCEHLLGGCAAFVDTVLKSSTGVTIIATSREPLRADIEQIYPLQPLSLPPPNGDFEALQRSEAAQLLSERLRQQLPDFQVTAHRAAAMAELCIRLDGIPLALELAAARARSLSIEQINARLGNRFRVLTSGSRGASPRQQTLRATLDWSYDLLGEDERIMLRRLAVFPGDFTPEAACAVAADANIDEFAVIDLLSQLVARSLLIAYTGADAMRYRLLETTHAYAHEKLLEAEETDELRRRHAEYYCKLFSRAPDDFLRLTDARLREIYAPELEHVRAALDWAFGPEGDRALGVSLAGASGPLWGTLGLFGEGARRLEVAAAHIDAGTPAREQALLWRQLGRLVDETPSRAEALLQRAASLYRLTDDRLGLAHTLLHLGRALGYVGNLSAGEAALMEAESLLEKIDVPWLHALYFFNMGLLKNRLRHFAEALSCYEHAYALFTKAGDEFSAASTKCNLANATWSLGDLDTTEALLREYVELMRISPMKTRRGLGWSLASLAGVLTERGALDEALVVAREALPLLLENGSAWVFVPHMALCAALRGRLSDAARLSGYTSRTWTEQHATPSPVEIYASERLHSILAASMPPDEIERLRAEGAKLSEAEAAELALAG